jgi:heme oxygenase
MVAAHLRGHLGPELPVTYLAQRNACTPRRWRRFDAYFSQLLQDGVALDEVTAGANAAYRLTTQALA